MSYCERIDGWENAGRPNLLGYVRNTHVYGDPRRHVYALDKDGNLLTKLEVTGEYPTTERTWFSQDEGWG